MDVTMDAEKQTVDSSSSSPGVLPTENHKDGQTHRSPHLGTVIPNRLFVGGIDHEVDESDLRHVFSHHGAVKEVKIVIDRTGISKGYGFVTFETQDDALKILHDANGICFKDKKLSIGQAVRKQQPSGPTKSAPVAGPDAAVHLSMYQTTSTGCPYTYHNGVAYFYRPNVNHAPHYWPRPAPPVMLPQSQQTVYRQPACHYYQCTPNQYQWSLMQPPMPSGPVVYSPLSECLYQPADGGSVPPPLPVMEDTVPENRMFPHSCAHLKDYYYYLPEAAEPPDASRFPTSHRPAPPVMLPQSQQTVYRQPACHYYQCTPNQYQWSLMQPPMPSGPVVYSPLSECLYQPADGGSVPPPLPVMEDTVPENRMFPHSCAHLKDYYYYLPEAAEPPDASRFPTSHVN